MDSVRFGRALGIGTRHAAKAIAMAADAAASPNPSPKQAPADAPQVTRPASERTARTAEQIRRTSAGVAEGSRQFGNSFFGRLKKLSGVLWLELTGVFFGLFFVVALSNIWKLHEHLRDTGSNHDQHQHLIWSVAMALVFGYFCISSFIRAHRKEHRGR